MNVDKATEDEIQAAFPLHSSTCDCPLAVRLDGEIARRVTAEGDDPCGGHRKYIP